MPISFLLFCISTICWIGIVMQIWKDHETLKTMGTHATCKRVHCNAPRQGQSRPGHIRMGIDASCYIFKANFRQYETKAPRQREGEGIGIWICGLGTIFNNMPICFNIYFNIFVGQRRVAAFLILNAMLVAHRSQFDWRQRGGSHGRVTETYVRTHTYRHTYVRRHY